MTPAHVTPAPAKGLAPHPANVVRGLAPGGFDRPAARQWPAEAANRAPNGRSWCPAIVVPAAAGTEAVLVWFSAEGNDRPTIDDIEVGRTAVVAWRVHGGAGGYGEPILVDEPSDNQHVLLPQSDGTLLEPSNAVFRNLDAAKASVLEDEQQRYDAEQAREERA